MINWIGFSRNGKPQWVDHSAENGAWKNTSGGQAILISGCAENDSSMDDCGDETMVMGALTYSFFAVAWSAHRPLTYGQLLAKTKAIIADCNKDSQTHCSLPAPIAPHVREVVNFSGVQEPQLSSSEKSILNPEFVEVRRNEPQTLNPCRLYLNFAIRLN
jgi:hypothetical protein